MIYLTLAEDCVARYEEHKYICFLSNQQIQKRVQRFKPFKMIKLCCL